MNVHRTNRTAATLAILAAALFAQRASAADETPRTAPATISDRRVVVSIPHRKLAFIENGEVVSVFQVAVDRPATPSPTGTFMIVNRVSQPTYYKPGNVIGPGTANPVGTRWIGLSQKGHGIHGTDKPRFDRLREIAWLHPAAEPRRREAVRPRASRRRRGTARREHTGNRAPLRRSPVMT